MGERLAAMGQIKNSPLYSVFDQLGLSLVGETLPILPIACEDVLDKAYLDEASTFTTWLGRSVISERLAQLWAQDQQITDINYIRARAYGELLGAPIVGSHNTLVERDEKRYMIIYKLRQCPPTIIEWRNHISEIIRQCQAVGGKPAPAEEVRRFIPEPRPLVVSEQAVAFYKHMGHVIPADVFTSPATKKLWQSRSDLTVAFVHFEDANMDLVDNLGPIWAHAKDSTILGFLELVARRQATHCRLFVAGAMFTLLRSLTKDMNLTNARMETQLLKFRKVLPELDISDYVSLETCKYFARLYPRKRLDLDIVYKLSVVIWNHFDTEGMTPITWIIKQPHISNMIWFTSIIEAVNSLVFYPVETTINYGIPATQYLYAIILMGHLYRNPFSTIIEPTFTPRQYTDLTALTICLTQDSLLNSEFRDYIKQSEGWSGPKIHHIRHVATFVWRQLEELGLKRESALLPIGTIKVDKSEMFKKLRIAETERAKAFRECCELMRNVITQTYEPAVTSMAAAHVHLPTKVVPRTICNAVKLWGGELPTEWTQVPPEYNSASRNPVEPTVEL